MGRWHSARSKRWHAMASLGGMRERFVRRGECSAVVRSLGEGTRAGKRALAMSWAGRRFTLAAVAVAEPGNETY